MVGERVVSVCVSREGTSRGVLMKRRRILNEFFWITGVSDVCSYTWPVGISHGRDYFRVPMCSQRLGNLSMWSGIFFGLGALVGDYGLHLILFLQI